jgi:hypothetical protein
MARVGLILGILLAVVVLAWPAPDSAEAEDNDALGDPDCDGRITSLDALIDLQEVAGLVSEVPCAANGDLDFNGDIESLDALYILQHVAGLLPIPFKSPPGLLIIFMPFLFLDNPDYECGLGNNFACTTNTLGGSDYLCTFNLSEPPLVDCNAEEAEWPDYVCDSIGNGDLACNTAASDWPDYDCTIIDFDQFDCQASAITYASYACSAKATIALCDTTSITHPDFTCEFVNSNASCSR